MSKGKLTRQELGWLLTQEAQGAADRLRRGVSALTQPPPPSDERDKREKIGMAAMGVDATFSVLDDAVKMLSNLHARPVNVRGRRGRIDLASLLWEVAPEAGVSIEPGSGTEVFGDEAELRRMLHVILGHGSGSGSAVTIKREDDEVVVVVVLGPDSSPTADTERAWLSRMAIRYGGRYELEGSTEVLALPAEGAQARDDVAKLQKELDEARKQGQAYARELAAVWASGEDAVVSSSYPPPEAGLAERHRALSRFAGGVAATLRAGLAPVGRELSELRGQGSSLRKSAPDAEAMARGEAEQRVESIRRKLLALRDLVAELAAIGETDPDEPARQVDLVEVARAQVRALEARAERAGVGVHVHATPTDSPVNAPSIMVTLAPRACAVLVRELVSHAIGASPRASSVAVSIVARGVDGLGPQIIVDDSGTALPASARRALLALEADPGTFGRPSTVALFVAAELALAQNARLDLSDAPSGSGGGVRATVTFLR